MQKGKTPEFGKRGGKRKILQKILFILFPAIAVSTFILSGNKFLWGGGISQGISFLGNAVLGDIKSENQIGISEEERKRIEDELNNLRKRIRNIAREKGIDSITAEDVIQSLDPRTLGILKKLYFDNGCPLPAGSFEECVERFLDEYKKVLRSNEEIIKKFSEGATSGEPGWVCPVNPAIKDKEVCYDEVRKQIVMLPVLALLGDKAGAFAEEKGWVLSPRVFKKEVPATATLAVEGVGCGITSGNLPNVSNWNVHFINVAWLKANPHNTLSWIGANLVNTAGGCDLTQDDCGVEQSLTPSQGEFFGLLQWVADEIEKSLTTQEVRQLVNEIICGIGTCQGMAGVTLCLALTENSPAPGGNTCYDKPADQWMFYYNKAVVEVLPDPVNGYLTILIALWAEGNVPGDPQAIPTHNTIDSGNARPTSEVCIEARSCADGWTYTHDDDPVRAYTEGVLLRFRLQPAVQGSLLDFCVVDAEMDMLGSDIDHPTLGCLADCVDQEPTFEKAFKDAAAKALDEYLHGNCPIPGSGGRTDRDLSLCPKITVRMPGGGGPAGPNCSNDVPPCPTYSSTWGCCWDYATSSMKCNCAGTGAPQCKHALLPIDLNELIQGRSFSPAQYCGRPTTAEDPPSGHAHEDPSKCYPGPINVGTLSIAKRSWYGTLSCGSGEYDLGCYTYSNRLILTGTGCSMSFDVGIRPKDLSQSCASSLATVDPTTMYTNTSGFFPRPAFGTENYAPFPLQNNSAFASWLSSKFLGSLALAGGNWDEGYATTSMGFNFNFYRTIDGAPPNPYSDLCINTNGYIGLPASNGGCTTPDNTPDPIPSTSAPNAYVAPMWADLSGDGNDFLYYKLELRGLFVSRIDQTEPPNCIACNDNPETVIGWTGSTAYYHRVFGWENNICDNATNFDNYVYAFNLPWDFPFFDRTTNRKLCIDSNGWVSPRFSAEACPGSDPTGETIPNPNAPNGIIAALWKDLDPAHVIDGDNRGGDCDGRCPECENGCINSCTTTPDSVVWFCHEPADQSCNPGWTYCPSGCPNCGTQRWCKNYDSVDNADCCPTGSDCSVACVPLCQTCRGVNFYCISGGTSCTTWTCMSSGSTDCGASYYFCDGTYQTWTDSCCPAGQGCDDGSCDANNNCTGTCRTPPFCDGTCRIGPCTPEDDCNCGAGNYCAGTCILGVCTNCDPSYTTDGCAAAGGFCYTAPGCRPDFNTNCRVGPCDGDTCNCSERTEHCEGSCVLGLCTNCDVRCNSTGGAGGCGAVDRCCFWRNGGWECACGTNQACSGGCEADSNFLDPEPQQRLFRVMGAGYVQVGQIDLDGNGIPDTIDCPGADLGNGLIDDDGDGIYYEDDDPSAPNCQHVVITWYKIPDFDAINDNGCGNDDNNDCTDTDEDCCSDWVCSGGDCSWCGVCQSDNRELCRLRQAGVLNPEPNYGGGRCANKNTFQVVLFSDGSIDINLENWTNTNVLIDPDGPGGSGCGPCGLCLTNCDCDPITNPRPHYVGIENYTGTSGVPIQDPFPNTTYRFVRVGFASAVCGTASLRTGYFTDCPDPANPTSYSKACRVVKWENFHVKGNAICVDMYAMLYASGTGFRPTQNYDIVFFYENFKAPLPGITDPADQAEAARKVNFPKIIGVENYYGTRGQYGFLPPDGTGILMRYEPEFVYWIGMGISQDALGDAAHMLYTSGFLCLALNPGGVQPTDADKFTDVGGFVPVGNLSDVESLQYFFPSVRYLCDPDDEAEIRLIPSGTEPASARTGTAWPSLLTPDAPSSSVPIGNFPSQFGNVQKYTDFTFLLPNYKAEFWCKQNSHPSGEFESDGNPGLAPVKLFEGYGDWFLAADLDYRVQDPSTGFLSNAPFRITRTIMFFLDVKPEISTINWNPAVPVSGRISGLADIFGDILSGYLQGILRTRISIPLGGGEPLHAWIKKIAPEGPDVTADEFPNTSKWQDIEAKYPWVVTMPDYFAVYIGCVDGNQDGIIDPIADCRDYSITGSLDIQFFLSGGGFFAPKITPENVPPPKKPRVEVVFPWGKVCSSEDGNGSCKLSPEEAKRLFGDGGVSKIYVIYDGVKKLSWRRNKTFWRVPFYFSEPSGEIEIRTGAWLDGKNELALLAIDENDYLWENIVKIEFELDRVGPYISVEGGDFDDELGMRVFHREGEQYLRMKIRDNVSEAQALVYSFKVDDGAWSEWKEVEDITHDPRGKEVGLGELRLSLRKGVYKLYVRAKDKAGNLSEWSEIIYVKGDEVMGCPFIGTVVEDDVKKFFSVLNSLVPISIILFAFYIMKSRGRKNGVRERFREKREQRNK